MTAAEPAGRSTGLPSPAGVFRVCLGVLVALAGALLLAGDVNASTQVAVATVLAASLALHVDLPWGGRLTLGHAAVIAIVAGLDPLPGLGVVAAGVFVSLPTWLDDGAGWTRAGLGGAASVAFAGAVAVGARMAAGELVPPSVDAGLEALLVATTLGLAFLLVDHLARSLLARLAGRRIDLRQSLPLALTILCVGVLFDLTRRESFWLSPLALIPLLVTRFAFQRYNAAVTTYGQTTMALSLLPEVAGLTPLGHSERTAAYVSVLAPTMGYDAVATAKLANVARLHHIGDISLHEEAERPGPPDPAELARVSAEILEQTGFLRDLVEMVTDCQPGGPPASTLDAAVVRVCSTLDDLVEVEHRVDPFAALVSMHPVGHERTVAIALLSLSHQRTGIVDEARGSVAEIRRIAEEVRAGSHHDH